MASEQIPGFDYDDPPAALTQILAWLEERIDPAHLAAVDERHIKALEWEPLDRPPMTFSAPVDEPLAVYPYSEVFQDPTKMFVNELVGPYAVMGSTPSIINSVIIKDDFPLQIRAAYGVGLFVSLFGVESEVVEDNFPWVRPIGLEALKGQVSRGVPDIKSSLVDRVLETMAYYKEILAPYPICRESISITQPDLQGPFENALHLWGSEIFSAFYDNPDFLKELLDLIAETWVQLSRKLAAASTERVREDYIYQHFGIFKGNCLIKDDSCVMISPETYVEFIQPLDEKVFKALGAGGIHWCGNGDQWRSHVVQTRNLTCLDWGNPEMLDLAAWSKVLREHRLPVARMGWKAEAWREVAPEKLFPTGAGFTIYVDNLETARQMLQNGEGK